MQIGRVCMVGWGEEGVDQVIRVMPIGLVRFPLTLKP